MRLGCGSRLAFEKVNSEFRDLTSGGYF